LKWKRSTQYSGSWNGYTVAEFSMTRGVVWVAYHGKEWIGVFDDKETAKRECKNHATQ